VQEFSPLRRERLKRALDELHHHYSISYAPFFIVLLLYSSPTRDCPRSWMLSAPCSARLIGETHSRPPLETPGWSPIIPSRTSRRFRAVRVPVAVYSSSWSCRRPPARNRKEPLPVRLRRSAPGYCRHRTGISRAAARSLWSAPSVILRVHVVKISGPH